MTVCIRLVEALEVSALSDTVSCTRMYVRIVYGLCLSVSYRELLIGGSKFVSVLAD